MTPKEKAIQLYNKFSNAANSHIEGKKCALICVDELIKECTVYRPSPESRFDYWQEVKKEIEKL